MRISDWSSDVCSSDLMRTGAVTAIGAKYLARKTSKILGHVGARGTAYWNVRLMDRIFDFDEIRVHSRRVESREAFAEKRSEEHTSELQSLMRISYDVFCLKKKIKKLKQ